jgi:putative spermidine/putrescine transport system permease protein
MPESVVKMNKKWGRLDVWQAMKLTSQSLTPGFYATALDGKYTVDQGFISQVENRQIYVKLFWRTLLISGSVMLLCLLLGYPVAYLLATLAIALFKFADDHGSVTVLDFAFGANNRVDCHFAITGGGQ